MALIGVDFPLVIASIAFAVALDSRNDAARATELVDWPEAWVDSSYRRHDRHKPSAAYLVVEHAVEDVLGPSLS